MTGRQIAAEVNRLIAAEGGQEIIKTSRGAVRFFGGDSEKWSTPFTGASHLYQLSPEKWMDKWRRMRAEYLKNQ